MDNPVAIERDTMVEIANAIRERMERGSTNNGGSSIFGVCWDYSNTSPALERLQPDTDPYRCVNTRIDEEPVVATDTREGSSPFDAYMPWKGMEQYNILPDNTIIKRGEEGFSQTEHDTMVWIPEFYYKVIDVPEQSKRYWYISEGETEEFEKHPGSGRYVGRYLVSHYNDSTSSQSKVLTNILYTRIRNNILEKGNNWYLNDYATWSAIQILYLVEFATFNSRNIFGTGNTNRYVGYTDVINYHTGISPDNHSIQYRWIEDIYGVAYEALDGVKFSDFCIYVSLDPETYDDSFEITNGYTKISDIRISNEGYIKKLGYSENFPWAFFPSELGGTNTTYVTEYAWKAIYHFAVGGHNSTTSAGMFLFGSDINNSFGDICGRLLYIPKE